MKFNIFTADTAGNSRNCIYKNRHIITSEKELANAVKFDYVCAAYKNGYRKNANFRASDLISFDVDNEHSEDPKDWATPEIVAEVFDGTEFAVHFSRNNMKKKNGKTARPKFHVLFPIAKVTDAEKYKEMKGAAARIFPRFDLNALDAARFFFGTKEAEVKFFEGTRKLDEFLAGYDEFDAGMAKGSYGVKTIAEGSRNSEMSRYATRVIKRFGITDKARELFSEQAERCIPPLGEAELNTIWQSAVKLGKKMVSDGSYIPPEDYGTEFELMPPDTSDVGQAQVLSREYEHKIRFSTATDFIVYNGSYWEESALNAQAIAQELTERQLKEAESVMDRCVNSLKEFGAWKKIKKSGKRKVTDVPELTEEDLELYEKFEEARAYKHYAVKRRDTRYIGAALKEARPALQIKPSELDKDEFLLNTPEGTYNLKTGELKEQRAEDFITKQTSVRVSDKGKELWLEALDTFFQGDKELIKYVQEVAGLSAVGKIYFEAMIIAHGEGANGKSTFWNTLSRVMGSYSGNLSADTLTIGCKRNVKPELAELKGKRLVIAAELEEGVRLNTSNVKQLCSTDEIYAEKKYRDPFSFTPTHTLVLYTNHLPRVGALDAGTWRRLVIIPFNAEIKGNADIKNYSDYLYNNAGEAVLQWICEGAWRIIKKDFKLEMPEAVKIATEKYRENNNWLAKFLDEKCEVGESLWAKSGEVYAEYRQFCEQTREYKRSTSDFYGALEAAGFERKKTNRGILIFGLSLKSEFEPEKDPEY